MIRKSKRISARRAKLRSTRTRVNIIITVSLLWAFPGLIGLVVGIANLELVTVLGGVAWAGIGVGVASLASTLRAVDARGLELQDKVATLSDQLAALGVGDPVVAGASAD